MQEISLFVLHEIFSTGHYKQPTCPKQRIKCFFEESFFKDVNICEELIFFVPAQIQNSI